MGKNISGKELGRGISQRADGRYQARFTDKFGKMHYLYDTNLVDLKQRFREEKERARDADIDASKSPTLNVWFNTWLDTYKVNIRDTTRSSYIFTYATIGPSIGKYRLCDITHHQLQSTFNKLSSDSAREKAKKLLSAMFKTAIRNGYASVNPTEGLTIDINHDRRSRDALTYDEAELFIKTAKEVGAKYYPLFVLALNTGMRLGELLALTWDDIDLENKVIYVRHTFIYKWTQDGMLIKFSEPKTKSSFRTIPCTIPELVLLGKASMPTEKFNKRDKVTDEDLKGDIERNRDINNGERQRDRVTYGDKERDKEIKVAGITNEQLNNLVFKSTNGEPCKPHSVQTSINYVVKMINKQQHFKHITCHTFRHTFATMCASQGMSPAALKAIMGHSSIRTTYDIYTHLSDKSLAEQLNMVKLPQVCSKCVSDDN